VSRIGSGRDGCVHGDLLKVPASSRCASARTARRSRAGSKSRGPRRALRAQALEEGRLGPAAGDQRSERGIVADRKIAIVRLTEQADRAADPGGEDRHAAAHRLDQHVGPALHQRGQQQQAATPDPLPGCGVGQRAAPLDAGVGGRGGRERSAAGLVARIADVNQPQVGGGQARQRAHRRQRVLLGPQVPDQQQIEAAPAGFTGTQRARRLRDHLGTGPQGRIELVRPALLQAHQPVGERERALRGGVDADVPVQVGAGQDQRERPAGLGEPLDRPRRATRMQGDHGIGPPAGVARETVLGTPVGADLDTMARPQESAPAPGRLPVAVVGSGQRGRDNRDARQTAHGERRPAVPVRASAGEPDDDRAWTITGRGILEAVRAGHARAGIARDP